MENKIHGASAKLLYYTARQLRKGLWQFEDGWDAEAKAQHAARFYRREYRRRCIVIAVQEGQNKWDVLRATLWTTEPKETQPNA